ncbi:hypothetical protein GIR22_03910 [Pseudomonas sp. CCM 7891]|uniref:DUF3077 domain-containing protein n=1 Tax=Pseudomonas karstica TaxID=1055468 RepID=A0A7X2RNU8_9PSED|nr:DUF6124 family protein [Pseudomonas karstica]MTD18289.1 hypothetical protein [Pseudomonas karstica]
MIKDSPNPPHHSSYDASLLQEAAYRAINHYLNPESQAQAQAPIDEPTEPPFDGLFTVRADLDAQTLLVNASQDLASINVIAAHLAFEVDGIQRNVALGICRMLEGVQMLVDKALDGCAQTTSK